MTLGQLKATLGFDTAGLKSAGQAVSRFVGDTKQQLLGLERFAEQNAKTLTNFGKKLSVALTAPLLAFSVFAGKQALEAESIGRRFESSFGPAFAGVNRQIQTLTKIIPEGASALQLMTVRTKDLAVALGVAPDRAKEMAIGVLRIAGALNRMKSVDTGEALDALRNSLAGNTKGLREFDIAIDDASIQNEALRSGILGLNQELTAAGRAQVIYNLLQRQTSTIQQQAATATQTSSQKFAQFRRDLADAAEQLGNKLLPAFTAFLGNATQVLQVLNRLDPNFVNLAVTIGAVAAAAGPVLAGLGSMIGVIVQMTGAVRTLIASSAMGGMLSILGPLGLALGAVAVGALFLFGKRLAETVHQAQLMNKEMIQLDSVMSRLSQNAGNIPFMTQWIEDTDEALQRLGVFRQAVEGLKPLKTIVGIEVPKGGTTLQAFNIVPDEVKEILQTLGLGQNATVSDVLGKITSEVQRLGERRAKLVEAINLARNLGNVGAGSPLGADAATLVTSTKSDIDALEDSVKNMQLTFEQIPGALETQSGFWLEIHDLQRKALEILLKQKDQYGEIAVRARDVLATVTQIRTQTPLNLTAANAGGSLQDAADRLRRNIRVTPGAPSDVANLKTGLEARISVLQSLVTRFSQAQDQLVLQSAIGSGTGIAEAKRDMESLRASARAVGAGLASFLGGAGIKNGEFRQGLEALTEAFTRMGIELEGLETPAGKLEQQLGKIGQAGEAAVNAILGAFKGVGQVIRSTVTGISGLFSGTGALLASVRQIKTERQAAKAAGGSTLGSFGSVLGFVDAAASIAGSIGGLVSALGAHAREIRAALRSNEESISAAQLELSGILQDPDAIRRAGKAATAAAGDVNEFLAFLDHIGPASLTAPVGTVQDALEAFGFTLDEINAIAKSQGVTLLDSKGQIIGGAFEQLAKRLGLTEEQLKRLGDTTDSITESITNIPTWYRAMLNQQRFTASVPVSNVPAATSTEASLSVAPGAIVITVSQADLQDATNLANVVLQKLREQARRGGGNPTTLARVM